MVVLPFDPVIAIIGVFVYQLANSISLTINIFLSKAFKIISESLGIPGETIHISASKILSE